MLHISPIYAGLLGLLFIGLSARVIRGRYNHHVSVGDGENKDLIKRIRVQANCAEYAPIGVILLTIAELQGLSPAVLHLLGLSLVAGRVMHAVGFGRTPQFPPFRIGGMVLTMAMITVSAVLVIFTALT